MQRIGISLDAIQERRQRFDLRSKIEPALDSGIVERFDTEAIARHEHLTALRIPDREGEHTLRRSTQRSPHLPYARRMTSVSEVVSKLSSPSSRRNSI